MACTHHHILVVVLAVDSWEATELSSAPCSAAVLATALPAYPETEIVVAHAHDEPRPRTGHGVVVSAVQCEQ